MSGTFISAPLYLSVTSYSYELIQQYVTLIHLSRLAAAFSLLHSLELSWRA